MIITALISSCLTVICSYVNLVAANDSITSTFSFPGSHLETWTPCRETQQRNVVMQRETKTCRFSAFSYEAIKPLCNYAPQTVCSSFTLGNKNKGNQSSSCHFNFFVLGSQGFSKHIKRAENYPNAETLMAVEKGLIFRVCSDVPGRPAGVSQDSCLKSSWTGRKRSGAGLKHGRPTGCGAGKTREGKLSQSCSSHYIKEGGYVTPVGSC